MTPPDADAEHEWLRRNGLFREVVGYREAVALLSDPRLRVIDVFESMGLTEEGKARGLTDASLLSTDGEEHRRIRSAVGKWFTSRAVAALRPHAKAIAHELIDQLVDAGTCDLVPAFSRPYVQRANAQYVGLPLDELADYWPGIEALATAKGPEDYRRGGILLADYAEHALASARAEPGDGVLGELAREVNEGVVEERYAVGLIATLLSAGHEPPINQISITVSVLAHYPDAWSAVASGAVAPASMVEAVLRFRSTNRGVIRRLAEPVAFDGVEFKNGESLIVNTAAADRDARQFRDPDSFETGGGSAQHLAFGFGAHYCLGAPLARVLLQEALLALVGRITCPTVIEEVEIDGGGLSGVSSLVISYDRA